MATVEENTASKVQERLQKRHQSRLEDAERRREAKESHKPAEEHTDYFKREFNRERAAVEELLRACPGAHRAEAAELLEQATAQTALVQKFVNDSMLFLTQYDLRQAQAALQNLQSALNEARQEAMPKKKFAFRARTKATETTPTEASDPEKTPTEASDPEKTPTEASDPDTMTDGGRGKAETGQCGFCHLTDASVTKSAEEIQQRDVLLTHLQNCKVKLLGSPSTLHLKHIEGCEILCGPVSTSVFVDDCRNSVLSFPCQQLRTHRTSGTQVYLHVTSRAILEDCTGVGFAPFSWSYPGLERDFQVSGLDRSRNNWSDVDDFDWLAAGTPSPNWTVIPEDERLTWDT